MPDLNDDSLYNARPKSQLKPEINQSGTSACSNPQVRPACPVCGGELMEIRAKLHCTQCHTICETCCEGGRG
jgi:hypothetical protein